ncbi:alpha/beta hydrolase [Variovorax robiniae]|uniref:Alpha/beta hydrolase n=1 Tax=Variovorax robiniae TaxID=1836199 RepID=A0ABU8X9U2_9BURK
MKHKQISLVSASTAIAAGMPQERRAGRPDREARAFLRWFNLASRRPPKAYSMAQLRLLWKLMALALGRRVPVTSVIERVIDGPAGPIEMRVYSPRPGAKPAPAFLWCHGGGFVVGGLDSADSICRNIASEAGCIVIAVRYRLAPEHDLNAGREDFLAALEWVADEGEALGIDTTRLAVGGDSAGGNIAAAVAQEMVRRGRQALRLQVLAYPATDLVQAFPSATENARGYMVTAETLAHVQSLVGVPANATDPWLSPARSTDLRGLAPAVVISAGFDPIRDDGLHYAGRLRAAGVPVDLLHYAGQFHGFLNFDAVMGAGRDALQRIGAALAHAFGDAEPVNRTIEIADEASDTAHCSALDSSVEVASTTLTAWVGAERWLAALLRLLSPAAAGATRMLLKPALAPATLARNEAVTRLGRLAARQTYPTAGT